MAACSSAQRRLVLTSSCRRWRCSRGRRVNSIAKPAVSPGRLWRTTTPERSSDPPRSGASSTSSKTVPIGSACVAMTNTPVSETFTILQGSRPLIVTAPDFERLAVDQLGRARLGILEKILVRRLGFRALGRRNFRKRRQKFCELVLLERALPGVQAFVPHEIGELQSALLDHESQGRSVERTQDLAPHMDEPRLLTHA